MHIYICHITRVNALLCSLNKMILARYVTCLIYVFILCIYSCNIIKLWLYCCYSITSNCPPEVEAYMETFVSSLLWVANAADVYFTINPV